MKYIKKLLSEQTRTTGRGEKTKGATSHKMQPNSTRTKPAIRNKVAAAREIGPKPGQLPDSKKREDSQKREDSHTVYHQMGMLMAEALGLVSEGKFDYMQDTPAGEAKTREAQKERARKETEDNRKAIAAAVQRRGGSSSSTTTTTPRPASEADPDTPGQRAVAKRYGRSSTA